MANDIPKPKPDVKKAIPQHKQMAMGKPVNQDRRGPIPRP